MVHRPFVRVWFVFRGLASTNNRNVATSVASAFSVCDALRLIRHGGASSVSNLSYQIRQFLEITEERNIEAVSEHA
jgi:hypothetical protein